MKLKFLGTGGGRYVTAEQKRKTSGMLLKTEETKIHIDPGPGALVEAQENNPEETEAVLVTHAHLDHANDTEAIIEMMTYCHDQPGTIFANESALKGYSDVEKRISSYHQDLCRDVHNLSEEKEVEFKDITIESQEMFHGDPKVFGFKLSDGDKKWGFWSDSQYSTELTEFYSDCDMLVINCSRPRNNSVKGHTDSGDIPEIMEDTEVKTAIITHFGYLFLENMEKEKEWLEENVDAKLIFAEDGMSFPGDRSLMNF